MYIPEPRKQDERFFCQVENCPHRYATREGYVTLEGYQRHYQKIHYQSVRVGFISRVDYGSSGYREGLFEAAAEVFTKENLDFVVWAGGLVSHHLRAELKKRLKGLRGEDREQERKRLLDRWASELDRAIPKFRDEKGKLLKIYIINSPSTSYDGELGAEIAERLAKNRWRSIRLWGNKGSGRFSLQHIKKDVWVLLPQRASWRGEYFSTPADGIIRDKEKQTAQELPDLWVVGCLASALQRPAGERKRPYITLPALHRLEEVHTVENQVGVRIVEFFPHTDRFAVRTYSFKDLVAREWENIPGPPASFKLGQSIVAKLRERPMTIGELEDGLRVSRTKIAAEIDTLNQSGYKPQIVLQEGSLQYRFDPFWIQKELRYVLPPAEELLEETLVAGACIHAGAPTTEYQFLVNQVPKLILEHEATTLAIAGDIIQGLAHDLDRRGEVILGLNLTQQEKLAAMLVGTVAVRVFRERIQKAVTNGRIGQEQLMKAVEEALLLIIYCSGNHDEWIARSGVTPLVTFHSELLDFITEGITETLKEFGVKLDTPVRDIVKEKVREGEKHTLPSGLDVEIRHPHMARTKTASIRPQQVLSVSDAPVAISGNFHVTTVVNQWEADRGERIALQIGTVMWMSEFEHQRLKELDTGVGILRVLFDTERRIYMTEVILTNEGTQEETFTNEDALQLFTKKLGIG